MNWGNVNTSKIRPKMAKFNLPIHTILPVVSRYVWNLVLGGMLLVVVFFYVVLSTPVFIYRLLVIHLIAPFFRQTIGKAVDTQSNAYATDLYQNDKAPRTAIVVDMVLEGTLPLELVFQVLNEGMVNATLDDGQLQYPELRQYVEPWLGFLFWKRDLDFNVQKHMITHTLEPHCTDRDSESFTCKLVEELLNKPFAKKKSPWELHVVHNYKMKGQNNRPCTMFVFRFQHCIADGYSILYAMVEGLCGVSLTKMSLFQTLERKLPSQKQNVPVMGYLFRAGHTALQVIKSVTRDVEFYIGLLSRVKSPWYLPDEKKHWKQIYARSDLIPIEKLKAIKNTLGVSFTGLVLSGVSAAVSKSLKWKATEDNKAGSISCLPTFSTVPMPGHPKGLRNHHAGVVFDIPVQINLNPMERVWECEKYLEIAKKSLLLPLGVAVWKLMGCQLAALNAKVFANPIIPAFLSNFPGPTLPLQLHGRNVLSTSFAVGAGSGVAGIGFMVLSYHDQVRVVLTAETATMTRDELQRLLRHIVEEFDILHEISLTKCHSLAKSEQLHVD